MKKLQIYNLPFLLAALFLLFANFGYSQNTSNHGNKFEQLGSILPSANEYRNNDGTPGPKYWQQACDYDITCTLDTEKQRLDGEETITYHNQSPNYAALHLDAT